MKDYLLLILSALILAADFSVNKLYQKKAGTGLGSGLKFNIILGLFTALLFAAFNGFKLEFSPFSIIMAFAMALLGTAYNITGFKIMSQGNISLYTFFLMTGGMVVPYIWGLIFLNERFSILHTAGLLVIAAAIFVINSGAQKMKAKQFVMCLAVFFLNGFVSVVSKEHQINAAAVSSTAFVALTGIARSIVSSAAFICTKSYKESSGIKLSSALPIVLVSAVFSGTSYLFQLFGAKNLPATVLYPIVTGGSIFFTALAGWLIFKEKITLKTALGILLCFMGTCMFL